MAEQFIEELYAFAKLPFILERCLEACRVKDAQLFSNTWNANSQNILSVCERLADRDSDSGMRLHAACKSLSSAGGNLIDIADTLEEVIIPEVYAYIASIEKIDVTDGEWRIVSTKSGLLNLYNNSTQKYYHSKINPLYDAWIEAGNLYESHINQIVVMGAGLGYLPYQLWKKSNETAKVVVLEKSSMVASFAKMYGVLEWISDDDLTVIVEENDATLFDKFTGLNVDYSRSVFVISDSFVEEIAEPLKTNMMDFIRNQRAATILSKYSDINYFNNRYKFDDRIEDFKTKVELNSNFVVVAAGPSLNDNIDYLKEIKDERTIIVVETALRKLLDNGIIPDFVTLIDPCADVMKYIKGLEAKTEEICLLAPVSAYSGYVDAFRGPAIKVYCGYNRHDDTDAQTMGIVDLGVHGTVSALAIEEAVYLGATYIEMIGLDLAFPDNNVYAEGLGLSTQDMSRFDVVCRSNDEKLVASSTVFQKFRCDIEQQISKYRNIKFVNYSKKGAYIAGTYTGKWYEKKPNTVSDVQDYLEKLADDRFLNWKEKYFLLQKIKGLDLAREKLSDTNGILLTVFENIVKDVMVEEVIGNNQIYGDIVYLITTLFDEADDNSKPLMEDAYKLITKYGKRVIIINTAESGGGVRTAFEVDDSIECVREYDDRSFIEYNGVKIPYFECVKPMPDEEKIYEILKFINENPPISIVSYDRFSLFTYLCSKYWLVEYR